MAQRTKSKAKSIEVDSIRHTGETRVNIPTEELRDFVAEEEAAPSTMLYPRDQSLDPQLVWKGKDEQDRQDLAVPVVPIYIQEKIHPQALIDDLPRVAKNPAIAQMDMFADFNGLDDFERKVEFYQHQQHWSNRLILGDSLMTMTSLAEKEGLKGKVQTIYIDPPYGIKFGSNWQVSTRKRDVKDGSVTDATRQPEQVKAFRDTWQMGIHSYLSYLRDRLVASREMLTESGSVFVQIGDENVHLIRSLMDEVFGAENFCSLIQVQKTGGQASELLASTVDFIIWYAKSKENVKYRQLYTGRERGSLSLERYDMIQTPGGDERRLSRSEIDRSVDAPAGRVLQHTSLISAGPASTDQSFVFNARTFLPGRASHWKTTVDGLSRLATAGRIVEGKNSIRYRRYLDDFAVVPINDRWESMQIGTELIYVVQTSTRSVERCILMTTDPGDLVLDPTCGSGTTAYVAEQWGRRWITIDTSRVALALARTRLMAAKFPYYHLADSPEGIRKETELTGKAPPPYATAGDIRKGFVYKRVPHVTLKSIANNPDIVEGMSREQIDAAIARHAEFETLYDQPYEDNRKVRVTGPFTVESLSPHRVLSTADTDHDGYVTPAETEAQADFVTMILENMRRSGVQNTFKGERLTFDYLEPFAGRHIHAKGQFTDVEGVAHAVALFIGPEHGTVTASDVKVAAIESQRGFPADVLLVCGFAFDAHVSEEAKQYGRLTVLATRMNPDLTMSELLKKTGAANLFMVFGEPDVKIDRTGDKLVVTIDGVDVYDPTTGAARPSSTDDIACWFIDTRYDEQNFFVRHAYFTGAQEPYDKLKRALRADIDEDAWASLYRTESRPFPVPDTGKIAVKVINHYGDEVMKVYTV